MQRIAIHIIWSDGRGEVSHVSDKAINRNDVRMPSKSGHIGGLHSFHQTLSMRGVEM